MSCSSALPCERCFSWPVTSVFWSFQRGCPLLCGPWVPPVPSCASFWTAQPRLDSGLGYLRLHCFAAHIQAACVGKGKWPTSPCPLTVWFLGSIQRLLFSHCLWRLCVSLPHRSLYLRPLLWLFFFQKKSACGIEMVLPFPTGAQSSQQNCVCNVTLGLSGCFHREAGFSVWAPAEHQCRKGNFPN